MGSSSRWIEPPATLTSCREIWDYLWSHLHDSSKANPGRFPHIPHLRALDISVGNFQPPDHEYLPYGYAPQPSMMRLHQRTFEVRLSERSAMRSGQCTVRCVKLDRALKLSREEPHKKDYWKKILPGIEADAHVGPDKPMRKPPRKSTESRVRR